MKNKHLILLFLLTLLIGLGFRHFPWRNKSWFDRPLLEINPTELEALWIALPNQDTLALVQDGDNWRGIQHGRGVTVPQEQMQILLSALQQINTAGISKSKRPDTLGFIPLQQIAVDLMLKSGKKEKLTLGKAIQEGGQILTCLRMGDQELVHLVKGNLREAFQVSLHDFRDKQMLHFDLNQLQQLQLKGDSLSPWFIPHRDSLAEVKTKILRLTNLPFADYFDESQANKARLFQLLLWPDSLQSPVTLTYYYQRPSELPEEWPGMRGKQGLPSPYVLHSSDNPGNYFALNDTAYARALIHYFCPNLPFYAE